MKKSVVEKYARLIARVGAGIKKGDAVTIRSSVEIYDFIEILVKECYIAGASNVEIDWSDDVITKIAYKYRTLDSFKDIPKWKTEKMRERVEKRPCRIHILSEAPDSLSGEFADDADVLHVFSFFTA